LESESWETISNGSLVERVRAKVALIFDELANGLGHGIRVVVKFQFLSF
jgi:hypothetical protein